LLKNTIKNVEHLFSRFEYQVTLSLLQREKTQYIQGPGWYLTVWVEESIELNQSTT